MTQPHLTREPEDGRIERWLEQRREQLPPPDRDAVLGGALRQIQNTPQRRRWWLLRWLPFGIGATRSSVPTEPRLEGSTRMMFNATRMAALVAVLAVGGSLALVAGPLSPESEVPGSPAAEAPGPEAASWFDGTGGVKILESGEESIVDGVGYLRGQVSQMLPRLIEVDDPRVGGAQTFTQHAADYGGFGPTWGLMRIEDDEGAWVGDVSGAWSNRGTRFSGWLTGEGAYDGLIQFYQAEFGSAVDVEFSGVIYPADSPPLELEAALAE